MPNGARMLLKRLILATALFTLAFTNIGCGSGTVVRSVVETTQQVRQAQQQIQRMTSTEVDESYAQSLKSATQAGPGLVVCEPVASNELKTFNDFSAGCARWLHMHVGGHGELGQTPLWGQVAEARKDMKRADLRFSPPDAARLASLTGTTHIATSTLSGIDKKLVLSFQMQQAHPSSKPLGAPIVLSGTREQITSKLPGAAREMAKRLGVRLPRVPAIAISAPDLAVLGRAPWKTTQPVDAATTQKLKALASREPLAGVLFLRSKGISWKLDAQSLAVIDTFLRRTPDNLLLVADAARLGDLTLVGHEQAISRHYTRFPNSFLAAFAQRVWQQSQGNWQEARNAAENAVRAAPRNSLAWINLSECLEEQARSIRQGQFYSRMTAAQRSAVAVLYPQRLSAAWRATQIAPQNSYAWSEVAIAATFNGNDAVADQALWKAQALDPSNNKVYIWGLQMYQPKWGGDPKKLEKIARLAVQHADPNDFPASGLSEGIYHGGLHNVREELLKAAIKRSPRNVILNYEWGALYHYYKRDYKTAEKYYRIALAADPNYARAVGSLADLYFFVKGDSAKAGQLYRKAAALAPSDRSLQDKLARFSAASAVPRPPMPPRPPNAARPPGVALPPRASQPPGAAQPPGVVRPPDASRPPSALQPPGAP